MERPAKGRPRVLSVLEEETQEGFLLIEFAYEPYQFDSSHYLRGKRYTERPLSDREFVIGIKGWRHKVSKFYYDVQFLIAQLPYTRCD